jgi:glycosyltransferase involved in cell wall biosynthesis
MRKRQSAPQSASRCLSARETIKRIAGLDDIEIVVVSDGSTDGTEGS